MTLRVRKRALAGFALALGAIFAFPGCTVDGSFLNTELFLCEVSSDCGSGWGCARATPYAPDFCAPNCASECDGVCVAQGEAGACLSECRIHEDLTTSACPSEDYDCIRVSVEDDDGVCYPVDGCSTSAECSAEHECLTALVEGIGIGGGGLRADNLYCVPVPDNPEDCPPRSIAVAFPLSEDQVFPMCLAVCDATDTRCPPAFGCLRHHVILGQAACFPGFYGIPCDDDTNCLQGRCIDTGVSGKFCTTTCDEALRVGFGCENISAPLNTFGLRYRLECDPSAPGGADGGGLCVPRYEIGFPCTTPESEAFVCAADLSCEAIADGVQKGCTKDCSSDDHCNVDGRSEDNYCSSFFDLCFPKQDTGGACIRDGNCQSDACVLGMDGRRTCQ
ncbi:MAG: hypothetical protein DRJ42_01745 [Deltaproteobacteria bacterium]|nr:MAG: hypothetical protein DRJ42_01745 [Deltaproteobacteria bacterium]